jgi:hypothetical protein
MKTHISLPNTVKKIIFNHESFIGTEDAITINGLQNLNDMVTLKNGDTISIRLLLKSLSASQGMSRPQLFQFVEPNNSGVTTLATFQTSDHEFIDKCKDLLESELHAIIKTEDASKLFVSDTEGIWCGGILKNKGGKSSQQNHLANILKITYPRFLISFTPPPKSVPSLLRPRKLLHPQHRDITIPSITIIPQRTLHLMIPTPSLIPLRTTPLTAQIDRRFSQIEETIQKHQEYNENFHQCLLNLESTTQNTDSNIALILNKMEAISTPSKICKTSPSLHSQQHDYEMEEDHHPGLLPQTQITGCAIP